MEGNVALAGVKLHALLLALAAIVEGACATTATNSPTSSEREQAVIAAMHHYEDALARNDVATLEEIFTDDFIFTTARARVVTRAQELDDIRAGQLRTEAARIDDVQVRSRGGLAVVTGRVTLRGTWRGQDFTGQYQVSATWVNERGRWRLLAIHSSRIPD